MCYYIFIISNTKNKDAHVMSKHGEVRVKVTISQRQKMNTLIERERWWWKGYKGDIREGTECDSRLTAACGREN